MILCVGEILADMIGVKNGNELKYDRKAGGAPFNVACSIKRFGAKASFIGAVGNDLIGDFLIDFVSKQNLDGGKVYKDEKRNTTLAFVELDENGERSFCFYRKNTADYNIPEIENKFIEEVDVVHIGSLMLSEQVGKEFAVNLAKKAKALGKIVSFDVNFRTDIFPNKNEAITIYKQMLELSDIVKFSEDEVEIFTQEYIDENLKDKLVCTTLGSDGSMWAYKGRTGKVPSIKVKPVDTTGAGDAFYGGVLAGLDGKKYGTWTEKELNEVFLFANVCGALNTLGRGAIDNLPTFSEVKEKAKEIKF